MRHLTYRSMLVLLPLTVACGDPSGLRTEPAASWRQVSAGGSHTCAVSSAGAAYCWGHNFFGELGSGTLESKAAPARVRSSVPFDSVYAGPSITCALTRDGAAYCWGANATGQLGDGTTVARTEPVAVQGGLRFRTLGVGTSHSCGVTVDGSLYCWGSDVYGQLGSGLAAAGRCPDANSPCALAPIRVASSSSFASVSVGSFQTCAVGTTGQGYCWGQDVSGHLGVGPVGSCIRFAMVTPCSTTPAPVRGGIVFRHIDVGHQYACGVDAAEHLYCWGIEAQERLGNGAGGSREITAPERVHNEFTMVSAGNDHACGVFAGNQGFCWGSGEYGAPGNGAAGAPQSRPGPVAGGLSFRSMQAGSRHSCGLTVTDDLYCWGYGRGGALGDETGSDSSVPVRVRAPS